MSLYRIRDSGDGGHFDADIAEKSLAYGGGLPRG